MADGSRRSSHEEALLSMLEGARVATVSVARASGFMPPRVAAAAEDLLREIAALVAAMRSIAILGADSDDARPRAELPLRHEHHAPQSGNGAHSA
jgi:hypothetical protein